MAKPLDPKEIEESRRSASRVERRNQRRQQMQEEIVRNQSGNGVIIIPPQKKTVMLDELPKLRVAAYCRVSTQEEQQVGSFDMQVLHFTKRIEGNPNWVLVEIYQDDTAIMGLNQNPVQTGVDLVPFFFLSALFSANEGVPA